jgi:hypothetical protein
MRALLLLALCAATAHAQPDRVHRLTSAPLVLTLPADFETAGETALDAETSVQVFSRIGTAGGPSPNTYVIVETHRGLSTLERFLFRRGVGIQRQTPSIAFERVDADRLPLAVRLAATVGSAFVATDVPDRVSAGLVVRGCDGHVCYAVAAQGPGTDAFAVAPLLAGVALAD